MIIYEVCVKKFINARHFKPQKADEEEMWSLLIDYRSEMFTRLHFQLPSLSLIEIAIGYIMSKNILLIP